MARRRRRMKQACQGRKEGENWLLRPHTKGFYLLGPNILFFICFDNQRVDSLWIDQGKQTEVRLGIPLQRFFFFFFGDDT